MTPPLVYADQAHAFTIRLSREERRNAIGSEVIAALDEALDQLEDVDPLKPIVLRGSGGWFASGGDIKEYADFTSDQAVAMAETVRRVLRRLENLDRPTVAAVNGPAIGGGAELALAFDLRIAVSDTYLRFPQTHLGITTGWQGSERLARLIGYSRAFDLLLTGRQIGSGEALAIGLVNAVYPPETFEEELSALVTALMRAGEAGVRTKRLLREAEGSMVTGSGESERAAFGELWSSEAHVSSMQRFLGRDRET